MPQVCCNLTLLNLHGAKSLTFKIKTTNPEQYFVCPRVGVLSPAQQLILRIFRLPQPEFAPITDRFLIEVETLPGYDDGQQSLDLSGSLRQQLSLKAALVSRHHLDNRPGMLCWKPVSSAIVACLASAL